MKKWYNVELKKDLANKVKAFCIDNNITIECSGCYDLIHIEVYCDNVEVEKINSFIDSVA